MGKKETKVHRHSQTESQSKSEGEEDIVNQDLELGTTVTPTKNKKKSKKRAAHDPDSAATDDKIEFVAKSHVVTSTASTLLVLFRNFTQNVLDGVEGTEGDHGVDDPNEPTMGEKLASLKLMENGEAKSPEAQDSSLPIKPPSADSVHVLLKQALHADDHTLLLDCLYTQDEKVINNSTSVLNPSDVFKLLKSLISIIQSRGAVLACAIPWLRSLLLQQASIIVSQESSLLALNSLYQLIEARISTYQSTLQLSSCMDFLYAGIGEDEDENDTITPFIYEDEDESDDEKSEDDMEVDQESIEHVDGDEMILKTNNIFD
ncbi:Small-subunit processome, Utp12 [Dillenia turbinata]|uniref:Small-subunit processome, Utp12 n=1 Tax=Dillenia turbinata TaxID=194707 RepID=A0AAN8YWK4_9MAGN